MKSSDYADFEISEDGGSKHATGHGLALTVEGGEIFHRRCIKMSANGSEQKQDSMLVCDLDGVRVYIKPPGHIIVTKRNLKL